MSEIQANKLSPSSGTALQIGDSGDTISIVGNHTIQTPANEQDAILIKQSDGTDVGSLRINNGSFLLKGKNSSSPVQIQTHDGNEDIEVDPDGFIKFETNGSERMRIDSNGDVGIGTTTINAKLVVSDNRSDYCARFINDGDDANRDGIMVQGGHDNGSGTTTYFLATDGDGNSTGELQTSNGTFQLVDTSDSRLKQDIVDTSINGIDSIKNLKVRDFAYKKNPTETIVGGFIAQELKEVFPQAVSEGKTDEKILSVSRERLVPLLTKSLQEAITKIETLEARVQALESE